MRSTPTLVDAALDDGFERLLKLALVNVVLILADADGLGIDLDEFGERVLQAAGDGDGAAHGEVEVGKLLARDVRGGVDAGAGFADGDGEDVVDACLAEEVANEGIRLARGGAVADGDGADVVLREERFRAWARLRHCRASRCAGR